MNIEFLYFDDCPNHKRALSLLRETLKESGLTADINPVVVNDNEEAACLKFVGSPTIRIKGTDIEAVSINTPFAKTCRVYVVDGVLSGVPSKSMIRRALWKAVHERIEE